MTLELQPLDLAMTEVAAALHKMAGFHEPWTARAFADLLTMPRTAGNVVLANAEPVGLALWRVAADEAEILTIAVAASHRGRGLSRDLLLTHLGHLAGRGVRTVFLEVEENNQPARRLYGRAGFATVGRRERYYRQPDGEQLNALLMRRDLS